MICKSCWHCCPSIITSKGDIKSNTNSTWAPVMSWEQCLRNQELPMCSWTLSNQKKQPQTSPPMPWEHVCLEMPTANHPFPCILFHLLIYHICAKHKRLGKWALRFQGAARSDKQARGDVFLRAVWKLSWRISDTLSQHQPYLYVLDVLQYFYQPRQSKSLSPALLLLHQEMQY